jgi:hypothetical protein
LPPTRASSFAWTVTTVNASHSERVFVPPFRVELFVAARADPIQSPDSRDKDSDKPEGHKRAGKDFGVKVASEWTDDQYTVRNPEHEESPKDEVSLSILDKRLSFINLLSRDSFESHLLRQRVAPANVKALYCHPREWCNASGYQTHFIVSDRQQRHGCLRAVRSIARQQRRRIHS